MSQQKNLLLLSSQKHAYIMNIIATATRLLVIFSINANGAQNYSFENGIGHSQLGVNCSALISPFLPESSEEVRKLHNCSEQYKFNQDLSIFTGSVYKSHFNHGNEG